MILEAKKQCFFSREKTGYLTLPFLATRLGGVGDEV